jgi:hypothetical protein
MQDSKFKLQEITDSRFVRQKLPMGRLNTSKPLQGTEITFETSNSMTGILRDVGSIKCRKNRSEPNVRESISSDATA